MYGTYAYAAIEYAGTLEVAEAEVVAVVDHRIYEVRDDRFKSKRGAFSNRADLFKKKLF